MKYIKPTVKVRKIKLNRFLSRWSPRDSFLSEPVLFAIYLPDTGSAGLKDRRVRFKKRFRNKNMH